MTRTIFTRLEITWPGSKRSSKRPASPPAAPGSVFLYDVTSVYFAREPSALAALGDHRDGKRGKRQMVVGRLSDGEQALRVARCNPATRARRADQWARVPDRHWDWTRVEQDFQTLKTGLWEIRPGFVRQEERTRGHAVVSLLALKLARALERRVAPLRLTGADAIERLKEVRRVRLRGSGNLGCGGWPKAFRRRRPRCWRCCPS